MEIFLAVLIKSSNITSFKIFQGGEFENWGLMCASLGVLRSSAMEFKELVSGAIWVYLT